MLYQLESTRTAATSASFIIISVILSTLVAATIVGNLFVILAILLDKNLQTTANQLVLSLAVADLMVACLVMPLGAYNDIHNGWYLSKEVCEFWTSADVLCCTASILNLLAIALDRYWAVTNVDYIYRRTRRRVNVMILCAWTVGAIVSLAPIFGWKDPDFAKRVVEEHKCMVSQDVSYQIFATISTFYAPLVLLLGLYWRIFQVARKRIRRKPGQTRSGAVGVNCKRTVGTKDDPIVCRLAADAATTSKQLPEQVKPISSQLVPSCDNRLGSFISNYNIQAARKARQDQPSPRVSSAVSAGETGAQSNYNSQRILDRGAGEVSSVAASTILMATRSTDEAQTEKATKVDDDKGGPNLNSFWPAALVREDKSSPYKWAAHGDYKASGAASDRSSIRGIDNVWGRDSIGAAATGSGRSETADSRGCDIQDQAERAAGLPVGCSGDDENNGPKQRYWAAMHRGAISVVGKSKQDEQDARHRRKDVWRRNKVAPIEELCPSRLQCCSMAAMPSQGEGQDPPGGGQSANDNNNRGDGAGEKVNDDDKWKRRRRDLEAEAQAFVGSPTSSVSRTSSCSGSKLMCLGGGASSGACGSNAQFEAMLLLSSSSSGVKMNEGVPVLPKQFNCSCLLPASTRGHPAALDGCCKRSQCYHQRARLDADDDEDDDNNHGDGGQRAKKEASSGRGHDGLTSGLCEAPHRSQKGAETGASTSNVGQINHKPGAPKRLDEGAAYLVVDGAVEAECSTKNSGACLKWSGVREDSPTAVATTTATVVVAAAAGAVEGEAQATASADGLNNKPDKHVEAQSWSSESRFCRDCESAAVVPGQETGRLVDGQSKPHRLTVDALTCADIDHTTTSTSTHLGPAKLLSSVCDNDPSSSVMVCRKFMVSKDSARNYSFGKDPDESEIEFDSSLSASSSLFGCLHQADLGANGQYDEPNHDDNDGGDVGEEEEVDDDQESSSLSTSFPPKPRDDRTSGPSSMPTSPHSDSLTKAHKRTPGHINNLVVRDLVAVVGLAREVDKAWPANGDSPSPAKLSVASNNLSTSSSLPLHLKTPTAPILMSSQLPDLSSPATAPVVSGELEPELSPGSKVKRKLENEGPPIQEQPMKWPIRLAHSIHIEPNNSSQPRQVRSSIQIRRRFRAMGRLVSFVQISRNLNSSFSSNSASSLRSTMGTADSRQEQPTAPSQGPLDFAGAALDDDLAAEQIISKSGQGAALSIDELETQAQQIRSRGDQKAEEPNQQQHQLANISGKLIDGNNTLCQRQRQQHQKEASSSVCANERALRPLASSSAVATTLTAPRSEQQDAKQQCHQHHYHNHRQKQMEMASSSGRTRTANMDIKREKKAAKTLAIITGVFVCCWLPFFLNAIIMPVCGPTCMPSDLVLSILLWLGYLNSLLNPIIYTIFSPDFRRAFRRLLCWPLLITFGCNPGTASTSQPIQTGKLVSNW